MKKFSTTLRHGFTMIELILVIVILGIVSSIGSEIIANVYENYLLQRATHRASFKTEIAAQQIANMLSYRIPKTALARNPSDVTDNRFITDPTDINDTTHTMLEWIGWDNDGFSAALLPPWNGFCNVSASDQSKIITPGSKLSNAKIIFKKLAGSTTDITPAIFFKPYEGINWVYAYDKTGPTTTYYEAIKSDNSPGCLGMTSSDTSCISTVSITNDETLTFNSMGSSNYKVITEHYKLAWSAYAIRPVSKNNSSLFDLELCYNYQPWEGERLSNAGCPTKSSTIITNVSVFKFAESGNTLRFKLCAQENIGGDYNITICKEKAVSL